MAVIVLLLLLLLQLTFQEDTVNYPSVRSAVRRQKPFAEEHPFPCDPSGPGARSPVRPTSVHRLRPGDIDVIGALGDSLIAGNGALEEYALAAFIEHRGVSWCAGGQGTWREFLTLPNILKVFNPNLMGYSTGQGEFLAPNSNFNVAFPVSIDDDAEKQARLLVHKMRRNPKIDFQNDWKMVTIMFGANDLCSAQCFNHEGHTASSHAQKLQAALDFLRDNSPRTFVNLIPVLDVSVSLRVKQTWMCRFLHTLFCQCFHRRRAGENVVDTVLKLVRDYQSAEQRLVRSGRYDDKEDFAVVLQPFTMYFNARPGHLHEEVIDVSYITHDCFHFSQKGHALAANLLWNNLLEPVGNKSLEMMAHIMDKIRCPTPEAPFLFTAANSRTFFRTGRQWETEEYKGSSTFQLYDENRLENN